MAEIIQLPLPMIYPEHVEWRFRDLWIRAEHRNAYNLFVAIIHLNPKWLYSRLRYGSLRGLEVV